MPRITHVRLPSLSEGIMDPWEMFCELTKRVVEDQNCQLEVFIGAHGISMMLVPFGDDWEDDDE